MEPRLFAYLSYRDAPRALDWLQALGFTLVRRQDDAQGALVHAELRLGEAVLMVGGFDADYDRAPLVGSSTGQGLYLLVQDGQDVEAMHSAAVAAGGTSVIAPQDTGWGAKRARVLDPEGLEWSFGTYQPGIADE